MRAALLALLLLSPAAASPVMLALRPDMGEASFSVHALGFWPVHGQFRRFTGTVRLDPDQPASCSVDVLVDVASLHMADPAMQADVLSPALLDAAEYPLLTYQGACVGDAIEGNMTLHGQTHRLRLALHRDRRNWVAEGGFRRSDWGNTGRPLLAGQEVRVRFSVAAPF